MPQLPTETPHLRHMPTTENLKTSMASSGPATTEDTAIQAHTVATVVIFCAVCLLLLLAFLYTFCFHCSIQAPPRDKRNNGYSLDREDATYRSSSSECPSAANAV